MKLRIFQSAHGDCLLLEGREGGRILCDGGISTSMRDFALPALAKAGKPIDFVYVSHIDQDHIGGVLELLENDLDWRVFDFHKKKGDKKVSKPKHPRPPQIGGIWHNAFPAMLDEEHAATIIDLLAAAAPALIATRAPDFSNAGEEMYGIATSITEAIKVSRLSSPEMLGIPLNHLPGSVKPKKLLMIEADGEPFEVGSMTLTILGPSKKALDDLQQGWNNWLRENADKVAKIDSELKKRMKGFSGAMVASQPIDLRDWQGMPDFKGVTVPNVASLMFMVEEQGKRLLLTGDSQQDFILDGLEQRGFLDQGALHVDVLKVQHHGSENNLDVKFARTVSADHYVFCGNGEHENPDLGVIQKVFDSRLGPKAKLAKAAKAQGRKFKMWFSTSADAGTGTVKAQSHMREVKALAQKMVAASKGQMEVRFNERAWISLTI